VEDAERFQAAVVLAEHPTGSRLYRCADRKGVGPRATAIRYAD
jgi:hypothetical protein